MNEIIFIVLAVLVITLVVKIGMKMLKWGIIAIALYLVWWFLVH